MWYQKLIQIFKIPSLRNKILFTLGILVIFRIMANIPIPGINIENLRAFFGAGQFQFLGLANLFIGGTLDRLSVIMLGLGPYITAVIILQLLTMIFPQLERLYKEEGEAGRQKFNQYGRLLAVPLSFLQGYGMLSLLQAGANPVIEHLSPFLLLTSLLTITAGTLFLMWLGELISEKGIGNGISILIFAGIISIFPANVGQIYLGWEAAKIPTYFFFFAMVLSIIAGVVLINEAKRNIPVSYAKRVRGNRLYGGVSTYLPLNVNPAGVMPIIFALSVLTFPMMITGFLREKEGLVGTLAASIGNFFDPQINPWGQAIFYFLLVFVFTYFYTAVTFDPKNIAKNLQKMGGFIPGIRPGSSTASFLYYVLNRVLLIGAIFLGTIAILPSIVGEITGVMVFQFLIGGTAVLIIVSVVLETMRQINAQLQMHEYETF
ncbi:MAG: preprotein translocase subunit SecY [Candidatus Nealsonbacteria bacterium]|nr:preprotein translocase subunit SecY [Candidatus Nealsonbacteria bacterium]